MINCKDKLGAFIVPTGVGASIGGFAGDASPYARKFAEVSKLIVNPNVVNAGGFSGICENMFYVEGYALNSFFNGEISLIPSFNNRIGVIFDKAIPQDVLNVHINTINAVNCVYGLNVSDFVITDKPVGIEFFVNDFGISMGKVSYEKVLLKSAQELLNRGCDAIAICCLFEDSNDINYALNGGVDPIGGVEAIISHYVSKTLNIPCAHSPAFCDYQIYPDIVDRRASSEYITPTFLPCILLALNVAPKLVKYSSNQINIGDLDYVVVPFNCLGSIPVLKAVELGKKVFAVKENVTVLNVTKENLFDKSDIIICETYSECLEQVKAL